MNPSPPSFSFSPTLARLAARCGGVALTLLVFCGAGSVPVQNLLPQGTMQADLNAGGHALTNVATASAGAFLTTATPPLVGYIGFPLGGNKGFVLGRSRDGRTFETQQIAYAPADGGTSRDVNLVCNQWTPLRDAAGNYTLLYTAGNFGITNYFSFVKTPDFRNFSGETHVPITGLSGTVNNTWVGPTSTDAAGHFAVLLRVSNQSGNNYGTPGIGYVTCSDPIPLPTSTWSAFTACSGLHAGTNVGSGPVLRTSTGWTLFVDEFNSGAGLTDLAYYTSTSSGVGPWTFGGYLGVAALRGSSVESAQIFQTGPNAYRMYLSNIAGGNVYYSESSSGYASGWSTPVPLGGCVSVGGPGQLGSGRPFLLNNYDDALTTLASVPTMPFQLNLSYLPSDSSFRIASATTYLRLTTTGGHTSFDVGPDFAQVIGDVFVCHNGFTAIGGMQADNLAVTNQVTFSGPGIDTRGTGHAGAGTFTIGPNDGSAGGTSIVIGGDQSEIHFSVFNNEDVGQGSSVDVTPNSISMGTTFGCPVLGSGQSVSGGDPLLRLDDGYGGTYGHYFTEPDDAGTPHSYKLPSGDGTLALTSQLSTATSTIASGTVYTLTASSAAVTFGTTSPTITLPTDGKYVITANVQTSYSGATYSAYQTATYKLRRTNHTAADLTDGARTSPLAVITTATAAGPQTVLTVTYTATAGDIIALYGAVSATPSAGSATTSAASIHAISVSN